MFESTVYEYEVHDFQYFLQCIETSIINLFTHKGTEIENSEEGIFKAETSGETITVKFSRISPVIYMLEMSSISKRLIGTRTNNKNNIKRFFQVFQQYFGVSHD